jgi:hypothetical protein
VNFLSNRPLAFHQLLRPSTVGDILKMPLLAQQIADRWALGWRARVTELESDGRLLAILWEQYELERSTLERFNGSEYAYLADHEKLELFGPPPGP